MKEDIIRLSETFLKKELKNDVGIDTLTAYLHRKGYPLIFYDPRKNNEVISSAGLSEYSKTVRAFTIKYKGTQAVFVDSTAPQSDKLSALLHEVAHIYLNHLDSNREAVDKRKQEMQAEAFVYAVFNRKPYKKTGIFFLAVSAAALTLLITFSRSFFSGIALADSLPSQSSDEVFITEGGGTYHRKSCIYLKNKDCTALPKARIKGSLSPCGVCKP